MNNWLNSLSHRERNLVSYGSIVVALILLWLLVLKPLYNNKIKYEKNIALQQKTLATMQKQRLEIKQLQHQAVARPTSTSNRNPQQLIENSLQTWRLKNVLERMQSQGNIGVRLTLKDANADRVMHFMHEIESKHALSITNLSIDNSNKQPGFADFKLTVKREDK